MRTPGRLGAIGAAAVVLTVACAGSAWGYFAVGGLGSGAAVTAQQAPPVRLAPGAVGQALLPGGTTDVVVVASNDGPSAVRLPALVVDTAQGSGGFSVDAGHSGCPTTSFSLGRQDAGGAGWTVPAGGSTTLRLSNALRAAADTPNACQGATVTVFLRSPA